MVYIRQKQLAGLHPYKYAGVDHSLVSRYVLKPFYTNVVIKCFPMSMAYVLHLPPWCLFIDRDQAERCKYQAANSTTEYILTRHNAPRSPSQASASSL